MCTALWYLPQIVFSGKQTLRQRIGKRKFIRKYSWDQTSLLSPLRPILKERTVPSTPGQGDDESKGMYDPAISLYVVILHPVPVLKNVSILIKATFFFLIECQ